MRPETIHIERTYPISIADLWRALTTKENMKEWFFEIPDFTMEIGGEFQFFRHQKQQNLLHKCQVIDVVPKQLFKFAWRHPRQTGESSIVTWRLIPRGGATTLHLTHEGLENFKGAGEQYSQESFENGWNYLLGETLSKFLDKQKVSS